MSYKEIEEAFQQEGERFSPKAKFYQERCEWLERRLAEADILLNRFLYHFKEREITNGFHDLLARDVRLYLEKYKR